MNSKTKGRLILLFVYLVAFSVGFWISTFTGYSILLKSAVAVASTVAIIYLGSFLCSNSSVFDPYWSIAPPLMVIYYMAMVVAEQPLVTHVSVSQLFSASPRMSILFMLTIAYSARLTWNFLHNWPGLKHEDWRYVDFRLNTGKAYWMVSLFGIHLFPALMVFGGTLSIWVTVVQGNRPLNMVDLMAILVTGYGILLEAAADRQLRKFLVQNKEVGKTMDQGLWAISRHPNYLGEILFWWGLYLFAFAANPSFWWAIIGPLAITVMFIFASIPMIEKRLLKRRKDYETYQEKVSMLVPWKFWGNRKR